MNPESSRASRILASFPRGPKSLTRVSLDEFKGRSFMNVRLWFMAPDGAWRPTRRGATFAVDELHDLQRAVQEAIQRTLGGKG